MKQHSHQKHESVLKACLVLPTYNEVENIESITKCCEYLGIKTKLIKASDLLAVGKKGDLVLNICKELNANEYFSTIGSKDYLENYRGGFEDAKVKIIYHDYIHPIYKQKGNIFLPNLSVLDLILSELDNAYT